MFDDTDTGFIAIEAVRYAMGRRTFAPTITTGWLLRHWQDLPAATRDIIIRDVRDEIARDDDARAGDSNYRPLGDDCDRETWVRFLRDIDKKED